MRRIMMIVAYDGSAYCGYQLQEGAVTIEQVLNETLTELLGERIRVSGASRTDSGVHALCNPVVFDSATPIPPTRIAFALNQRLPADIRVRGSVEVAPDFHPRYAKTVKTYEYRIFNSSFMDPCRGRYSFFCHYRLDTERMRQAARHLVGEHDFAAFCSAGSSARTTVRRVVSLEITEEKCRSPVTYAGRGLFPTEGDREIVIRVSGEGFLYNMVRIIAGTLMEVGRGAMEPEEVRKALGSRDRSLSGPTAPPQGLTLVGYEFREAPDIITPAGGA